MSTVISMAIVVIIGVFGIFSIIQDYAVNSLGEMKYMLKTAKERQEICYREETEKEIERLESNIENFWGRKLVRPKDVSMFDSFLK